MIGFNRRIRLLLLNQFTIKLGFNMLMPYLADHMAHGLGLAAWAVGLVLGVRNASQRGMSLVGGAVADRFGCKTAIVAGCALRTLGFGLLGVATDLPMLMVALAATGFAGALFDPGVRSYLAAEAGTDRVRAFAAFNVASQAGLLLGPLVGLALIGFDFSVVSAAAAAVFLALTVVQARALPPSRGAAAGGGLAGWHRVLGDRFFLAFSVAMSGAYVLSFQVYLALPLGMRHALGGEDGTGMSEAFALSAVVVIVGQPRIAAWARRRFTPPQALAAGLTVMALAFVPLIGDALPGPAGFGSEEVAETIGIAPLLLAAALLSVGMALVCPFEMDSIVALARGRLVATHYGLYTTLSGLAITLGSLATGAIWDASVRDGVAWLPWASMSALGAVCATALLILARTPRLRPEPVAEARERVLSGR